MPVKVYVIRFSFAAALLLGGLLIPSQPKAVLAATVTVTSTTDGSDGDTSSIAALNAFPGADGVISLREAIQAANNTAGPDSIGFNIPGGGVHTIAPASALPAVSSPVTIDGLSQPGAACDPWPPSLLIELDGSSAGAAVDGLLIRAGSSTVRGLVINRFGGDGIQLDTSGGNTIVCNLIGTNAAGTVDQGNVENGLYIWLVPNNVIGGTSAATRNLISGNNNSGVLIYGTSASGNLIQGNLIGTNAAGTADLGNSLAGVAITESPGNTIGGTTEAARNIISGNDYRGVTLSERTATGNHVQGNYIGTDHTGTAVLGNYYGVFIGNAPGNVVGGTAAGARNVISGNQHIGVSIQDVWSTGNQVQGNYIGTDYTGTAVLGNGLSDNYSSVNLSDSASGNTIGGNTAAARNLIAGGRWDGVRIYNSNGNVVQGNYIGTGVTGTEKFGHSRCGVSLTVANNNQIGGTGTGEANLITDSGRVAWMEGDGICPESGTGNLLSGNSIADNGNLGIDLGSNGVTANDAGDGDDGPNHLQNYPVLTSVTYSQSGVTVSGTLNSTANTTFHLEFFYSATADGTNYGEGAVYFGSYSAATNGSGDATFSVTFAAGPPPGYFVAATASDPENNTSEFSRCYQTPTAVSLTDFNARPARQRVDVEWTTAAEIDSAGFNLYRAEDAKGSRTRLNAALIPVQSPGSPVGARYVWHDDQVAPGVTYYYWLEAIDLHGGATVYGPAPAAMFAYRYLLPMVGR